MTPELKGACHTWSHDLGEGAVLYGYQSEQIIENCSLNCGGGCFNGAGHAYVSKNNDLVGIDNFCLPSNSKLENDRVLKCFHGVGHGLVDVFGTNVPFLLNKCNLIKNEQGKIECSHAIFMMFNSIPISRLNAGDIPQNMGKFCSEIDNAYQNNCRIFSGYLTFARTKNPMEGLKSCDGLEDRNNAECLKKTGNLVYIDLMYQKDVNKDPNFVITKCKRDYPRIDVWCSIGLGQALIADPGMNPVRAFDICNLVPGDFKTICYREIGEEILSVRGKTELISICQHFENSYAKACLGGYFN